MICDVVQVLGTDFDLGVDDRARFEAAQGAPEIFFAKRIPVVGSIVEKGYPALQGPADDMFLFGRRTTNHQPGIAAATESDLRHHKVSRTNASRLHAVPAEWPDLHAGRPGAWQTVYLSHQLSTTRADCRRPSLRISQST